MYPIEQSATPSLTIKSNAFDNCINLTSLASIPSTVTFIDNGAFKNISGLINVVTENKNYSSIDGVLLNKNQTLLLQCPNSKSGTYPREVFAFSFNKLDNSIIYSSDVGNVYNFNLNDETMNTIAQTSIGGRRFIASYSAINYAIKAYYSGGFDTQSLTRCLTSFVGKINCAAYEVDDNASGHLDTYIDTSFGMVFNSEGNRAYFLGRGNVDLTNIESLPVTMASCLVKQDGDIVSCKQINAGFSIPTFFSHRKEFGFAYADK